MLSSAGVRDRPDQCHGGAWIAGAGSTLAPCLVDIVHKSGRPTLVYRPPEPGELGGPAVEVLLVALAPGGVLVALLSTIVGWLRTRRTDIELRIKSSNDDEIFLSAKTLEGMDADDIAHLIQELASNLDGRVLPRRVGQHDGE
jgi:hypothetical protein